MDKIELLFPIFSRQSIIDSEELTALELAGRVAQKLNDQVDFINGVQTDIDSRAKSDDISNIRKLSPTGDFTGTISGETVSKVLGDISNSLSLANTIIDMVNNRESIGTVYDGGIFTDTTSPTTTIEGGTF